MTAFLRKVRAACATAVRKAIVGLLFGHTKRIASLTVPITRRPVPRGGANRVGCHAIDDLAGVLTMGLWTSGLHFWATTVGEDFLARLAGIDFEYMQALACRKRPIGMARAELHIRPLRQILALRSATLFSRIKRAKHRHRKRVWGFELLPAFVGRIIRMGDDLLPFRSDLAMMTCMPEVWLRGSNESGTPR